MTIKPAKKYRIRDPNQTRAKLLEATVDLIAQKGSEAVSVKEAAQVAKVSRAVAYQHFRDRRHLLREARVWIGEQLSRLPNVGSGSMEERIQRSAELTLGNPDLVQLFLIEALGGRNLSTDHPLYKSLLSRMREFSKSGSAREDMDVEVLCFILLGALPTLLLMKRHLENKNDADIARRFTREWILLLRQGMFAKRAAGPKAKKKVSSAKRKST